MSAGGLLGVESSELKFPFELMKRISCSFRIWNRTASYVAFKVKTSNPKNYCVRPNAGILLPWSTCEVMVTMREQRRAHPDLQCEDRFLLQSVKASYGATTKDINAAMFNKKAGNIVEEFKMRVVYVSPFQPPSPVAEGSEERSPQTQFFVARALIEKLSDEKESAIRQNDKLRRELELLRRGGYGNRGGVSFLVTFVGIVGLLTGIIGFMFGNLWKRT